MKLGTTLENALNEPDTTKLVILAGLCGGVLSMSFVDGMSTKQRIVAIISGMVMAHYLAPLIAFLFKEEEYQETIGFLIGLFGMSICAALFRGIQSSDVWGLIAARFSKE